MERSIPSGSLIYDQLGFFNPIGSFNRISGLTNSDVSLVLFFNNTVLSWDLLNGTSVQDSSISSGSVYFNEITGNLGYYSVRFFPNRTGNWKLSFKINSPIVYESILSYDIIPQNNVVSSGLNASFSK